MEGIAHVIRHEMKPEGELMKLMEELPEREQALYQEAVWGMIRNIDGRADKLQNVPISAVADVRATMKQAVKDAQARTEAKRAELKAKDGD